MLFRSGQRLVPKLGTVAQVGEVVGSVGHGLGTASDDNVGISGQDGLGTKDDGLGTGGAHLVDGGCDDRLGETSTKGGLASGVLTKAVTSQATGSYCSMP